jgi:hypothetical protein
LAYIGDTMPDWLTVTSAINCNSPNSTDVLSLIARLTHQFHQATLRRPPFLGPCPPRTVLSPAHQHST